MATSNNKTIQKLMNAVDAIDDAEENIEEKLNQIAQAIAAEQQKAREKISGVNVNAPVDPQDAFQCEGCQ